MVGKDLILLHKFTVSFSQNPCIVLGMLGAVEFVLNNIQYVDVICFTEHFFCVYVYFSGRGIETLGEISLKVWCGFCVL